MVTKEMRVEYVRRSRARKKNRDKLMRVYKFYQNDLEFLAYVLKMDKFELKQLLKQDNMTDELIEKIEIMLVEGCF